MAKNAAKQSTTKKTASKTGKNAAKKTAKKTSKKTARKAPVPATKKPAKKTPKKSGAKASKKVASKTSQKITKKAAKKTAKQSGKKTPTRAAPSKAVAPAGRVGPGSPAPAFTLPDQDGTEHTVGGVRARAAVLFFYPKDMTSGCTAEACDFRDLRAEFDAAGADVFGISIMGPKSKRKFADKESLNFPLLADDRETGGKPDPEVAQKYGVWVEKSMYGRTYMGLERVTFLIGADGAVARRWDKVKVPGHADEVLAAARSLA